MAEPGLDALAARLFQYRTPGELFGRLPGDEGERERTLEERRASLLARLGPPDRREGDLAALARKVEDFAGLVRGALADGSYDASVPAFGASFSSEIATRERTYRLVELLVEGERTNVYRGEYERDWGAVEEVAIKIPHSAEHDRATLNETRVLGLLSHKSLPILVDSFRASSGVAATITRLVDGVDLLEARERLPGGLPPEHACWVLDRLLAVLGFLHARRIIHGNVEPGNVLVRARDHNAFLIGFSFAIVDPARSGDGFGVAERPWSPPEAFQRRSPIPPSDLYSLGKTLIFALGGDPATSELPGGVDARLRRFLLRLVEPDPLDRPRDAWELCRELRVLRDRVFGTGRGFAELDL